MATDRTLFFTVTTETGAPGDFSALNNVLAAIRGAVGESFTITLGADLNLGAALTAVAVGAGSSLTIDGAGHTVDGNEAFAGSR
jgi:hypothetical protein